MMNELSLDLYDILGVSMDAQERDIRTAYRKLILIYHPDRVQESALEAQKQKEFHKIQQAYELLTDEEERKKYDDSIKPPERRKQERERERERERLRERGRETGRQYGRSLLMPENPFPRQQESRSRIRNSTNNEDIMSNEPQRRNPFVASSSQKGFSTSPTLASRSKWRKTNFQKKTNDSRMRRFGQLVTRSSSHRSESQGSRTSQISNRNMGSQVSWEGMDKFDYILQAMDDLVGKEIKRLQKLSWRHKSKESPKNQCEEFLLLLQQMIKKCIGLDHWLIPVSGYSKFLKPTP
jgi:DnaJ-class molecular chaperone